eukprot:TRINITY_DN1479_c0_g1_i1.p1 TRINITY_DN1479_c0_g1~~TRINITY_DN1479_c0_g1_i1.p1  ORF type:complete len:364 (+),score=77.55 TRINITY_DN1479_c0_g1_i1:167-1258(+)
MDKSKLSRVTAQLNKAATFDLPSLQTLWSLTPSCSQDTELALHAENKRSCPKDVDQAEVDTAASDQDLDPKVEESPSEEDSGEVRSQKASRPAREAAELLRDTKVVAPRYRKKTQASEPRIQTCADPSKMLSEQTTSHEAEADLKHRPAMNVGYGASLPRIGLNGNRSGFQRAEPLKAPWQDAFHTLPMKPPPGLTPPPGLAAPPGLPSPPGLPETAQPTAGLDYAECYGAPPVAQEMFSHSMAATWMPTLPPGTWNHSVGNVTSQSEANLMSEKENYGLSMKVKRMREKSQEDFEEDVRMLMAMDLKSLRARGDATLRSVNADRLQAQGAAMLYEMGHVPKTGRQISSRKVVNKKLPADFRE